MCLFMVNDSLSWASIIAVGVMHMHNVDRTELIKLT